MEFKEYLDKVKSAANLTDLDFIQDDYVFEFSPQATSAQNKEFEAAVDARKKELGGVMPQKSEFEVEAVTAKPAPKRKPAVTGKPRASPAIGQNYVIATPTASPPFTPPPIDFALYGKWEPVPTDDIGYVNPQLVNIPPKDWTFYMPHIENGKLMEMRIERRSEVGHLYTLLKNYMTEGGHSFLDAIWKTRNKNYFFDVGDTTITKVETMIFYEDEPVMYRKIFSFWGVNEGVIKPVPIVVMKE